MRRQWDRRDNVKLGWDVTYRQDWLTWLIVARITEESSEDYGGMDFKSDNGPPTTLLDTALLVVADHLLLVQSAAS